jgi:hypothetical protein
VDRVSGVFAWSGSTSSSQLMSHGAVPVPLLHGGGAMP